MDTFKVCVSRISTSEHEIEVEANNYQEAYKTALEKAGDFVFEEKSAEYKVSSINDVEISSFIEAKLQDRNDIIPDMNKEDKHFLESVLLKNLAIDSFSVNFSGSGDDGSIDGVEVEPWALQEVLDDVVCDGDTLETLLTNIASVMVYSENLPIDWVNGEGGQGSVIFELDDQNKLKTTFTVAENVSDTGITLTKVFK